PRAGPLVRGRGVRLLHRHPGRRLRLRLAEGSAGVGEVGRKKRLADYGLHSERLLMKRKPPGTFESELGDLEDKLMLTTVGKAVAWAQGHSIWPDTFGLPCGRMG